MNKLIIGLVTIAITCGGLAYAKELPPLQYLQNAKPGVEQKINVLMYHVEEDERIIRGLQQEVTKLHSMNDSLSAKLKTMDDELSAEINNIGKARKSK